MRSVKVIAVLVPLLLLAGCVKKPAKKPAADDPASAKVQPQPPATGDRDKKKDGKNGKDELNWLTDPRFKHESPTPGTPPEGPGATGKQSWGLAPPQGGWQAPAPGVQPAPLDPGAVAGGTPPVAPGPPAPGGMGILQPQPQPGATIPPTGGTPALRPVTQRDMLDLQIIIHDSSLVVGQMPTPEFIYKALVQAKTPVADLVKDGSISLTGATTRDSIWAFETKAITNGGLVVSQNGVETVTAAQLKQRLGK